MISHLLTKKTPWGYGRAGGIISVGRKKPEGIDQDNDGNNHVEGKVNLEIIFILRIKVFYLSHSPKDKLYLSPVASPMIQAWRN